MNWKKPVHLALLLLTTSFDGEGWCLEAKTGTSPRQLVLVMIVIGSWRTRLGLGLVISFTSWRMRLCFRFQDTVVEDAAAEGRMQWMEKALTHRVFRRSHTPHSSNNKPHKKRMDEKIFIEL